MPLETIQKDIERLEKTKFPDVWAEDSYQAIGKFLKQSQINTLKALVKEIEGKKKRTQIILKDRENAGFRSQDNLEVHGHLTALQDIQDDITRVLEELEK